MTHAEVADAASTYTEAMLERLETYVRIETPTGHRAQLDTLADLLLDRHRELGATTRRHPSDAGDHLVINHPGRGTKTGAPPVLLIGHHDTVWPLGHLDTAMPWRVDGDTAYGPGAYDMKGGLVVLETALELAGRLGLAHPPVRVVVVADEEVGSPTSSDLVRSCAEGATAALGFESPLPGGVLKTGRRGSVRVRLAVDGVEAHAALDPGAGVSAVDELIDQLIELRSIVASAPGEVLCNVGSIQGGGKTNVVPGKAWAEIGLRFTDPESERVVLQALLARRPARSGAAVRVEVLSQRPTWAAGALSAGLLNTVADVGRQLGQHVAGAAAAGAADTNTTGALGVATLDGFGPLGAGAHALHEHVVVSSMPQRTALVAAVLAAL